MKKKVAYPAVEIRRLKASEFSGYYKKYSKRYFLNHRLHYNLSSLLTKKEQALTAAIQIRMKDADHIFLGAFVNNQIVGWLYGYGATPSCFYISNALIFPKFRKRGYYSALLDKALQIAKKLGYETVTNHQYPTDSAFVAKKLDAGFYITGCEVNDVFGTMLRMTYFISPKRHKAFLGRIRDF